MHMANCRQLPEFIINPGDIIVKFAAPENRIVHRSGKAIDEVTISEKRILDEIIIDPGI